MKLFNFSRVYLKSYFEFIKNFKKQLVAKLLMKKTKLKRVFNPPLALMYIDFFKLILV